VRKARHKWTPVPIRWFSDPEFLSLSAVDLKLLLLWWRHTEEGEVPKCPRRALALAGLPVKPARVQQALETLLGLEYLVDGGAVYLLNDFGKIFRRNSGENSQRRKKTPGRMPKNSQSSAAPSRARILSPTGREKEREIIGPSSEGRADDSQELAKIRAELEEVLR
jgi:hypothetical protein